MIETARLHLRMLQAGDAPWLAGHIAAPDIQRWIPFLPNPYRLADAQAFVARHEGNPWCRLILHDQTPVGVIEIAPGATPPELGYWLTVAAHGKGYMTEAATALVDAFFRTGAVQIGSGWIDGNRASENVLGKLGFERTGQVIDRHVNFLNAPRPVIRAQLTRDRWRQTRMLEPQAQHR